MGSVGFKSALSNIIAIYGKSLEPFPWKLDPTDKMDIFGIGIIVEHDKKKYIIAPRGGFIQATVIYGYMLKYLDDGTEQQFKYTLHILFQSPDYDLIVLGTLNDACFCPSIDLSIEYTCIKPKKTSKCFVVNLNRFSDDKVTLYDVKYNGSKTVSLPITSNYIYVFDSCNADILPYIVYGIKKNKLFFYGITYSTSVNNEIHVTPSLVIMKAFDMYIKGNIPKYLHVDLTEIRMIDGKKLSSKKYLRDDILQDNVTVDAYCLYNQKDYYLCEYKKENKNIKTLLPLEQFAKIQLSNLSFYDPLQSMLFCDKNGLIFTHLTSDFIHTLFNSGFIDNNFFNDIIMKECKTSKIILVDCVNDKLYFKLCNTHAFDFVRTQKINEIYMLEYINNQLIHSFDELLSITDIKTLGILINNVISTKEITLKI